MKKTKAAVGLSGGVDSSVAAALLKERGYDVIGLSMAIYDESNEVAGFGKHACYGPGEKEDLDSAARVCRDLGIPFYVIDLKKEFKEVVIGYFRDEYLKGRTPNPCVLCNRRLKFGFLLKKLKKAGVDFDLFATGHYARVMKSGSRFLLKRSVDLSKDQSYFLYTLAQEQLSRITFPLGDYHKAQVRETALALGLKTAKRPESQDFIAGGDYSPFFETGEVQEGDIVNEQGERLGTHRGIIYYTIGQRKGLGISSRRPLYVTGIDAAENRLIVSDREERLQSSGLIAGNLNLISMDRLEKPLEVEVKIRLQHREAGATLYPHHGKVYHDHDKVYHYHDKWAKVLFHEPQAAVTPGQSAVFYQGDTVLGGGIIEEPIA